MTQLLQQSKTKKPTNLIYIQVQEIYVQEVFHNLIVIKTLYIEYKENWLQKCKCNTFELNLLKKYTTKKESKRQMLEKQKVLTS